MNVVDVKPVTSDLWPALEDLFGPSGASNGCWCMYWILGADYHRRPREQNRISLRDKVKCGPAPGLLALDRHGSALGWCRVSPRVELTWLNQRGELAPVDDLPVWSVPCFYVRRSARGEGVMQHLITAAVRQATEADAPALEAYPIDTSVAGSTRNIFPGTVVAFERAGFTVVARRKPDRPVMRHYLAGTTSTG